MKNRFVWVAGFCAVGMGFSIAALLANNASLSANNSRLINGSSKSACQSSTEPLMDRLHRNQVTAGVLIDALGNTDVIKRREAARVIVALRSHYIEELHRVIERNYKDSLPVSELKAGVKQSSEQATWNLLTALAYLRPSNEQVIKSAAQHFSFSWSPLTAYAGDELVAHRTTQVLVRASFSALPALSNFISTAPVSQNGNEATKDYTALLCAVSILKSATPMWLEGEADKAKDEKRKGSLQNSVNLIQDKLAPDQQSGLPRILRWFASARAFDDFVDDKVLDSIDPKTTRIEWDLPIDLVNSAELIHGTSTTENPQPHYDAAVLKIRRTMDLLTYGIAQRLTLDNNDRSKRYELYPVESQPDAIRVLGCLRPVQGFMGPWVLWQRLRQISRAHSIDQDSSEDTLVTLRAMGQMDVPSSRLLIGRIASQWGQDQQHAATYALSKIVGRYAVPLIGAEMAVRQRWADQETDKSRTGMYLKERQRLADALKLGQEKHWFEGEYYGYGDPHAYDLVFPPDDTPGQLAPPPATPQ